MIRREALDAENSPVWVLISQLVHAGVSGKLAEAWDDERRPLVTPRGWLVEAVRRHDDGWLVWEQRPEVHQGVPRDFMEMPLDESLAIWRTSIAVAATIDPAAGVVVGGHFRVLLERTLEKHETRHDWPADFEHLAEEFVAEQAVLRADYLATCAVGDRAAAEAAVDRGLHFLQLFDFASLWLCCAERTEPQAMPGPDGETYVFTPRGEQGIAVSPWPFRPDSLRLAVEGRQVPVAEYASAEALAAAPATTARLEWRLFRE